VLAWLLLRRCAEAGYGDSAYWMEKIRKEMSKKEKAEADRRIQDQ